MCVWEFFKILFCFLFVSVILCLCDPRHLYFISIVFLEMEVNTL